MLISGPFWCMQNFKLYHMVNNSLVIQVTAQDISTMIRCGQRTIIFLINNGGYTIEVEIHDGPYNVIKNWDYTGLVNAIHNGEGKCWTAKVSTSRFGWYITLLSYVWDIRFPLLPRYFFASAPNSGCSPSLIFNVLLGKFSL